MSNDVKLVLTNHGRAFILKGVTKMDEILAEMLEGGNGRASFGKASTTIWIMNLPIELKLRYADALSLMFLEMSRDEIRAVKSYVQFTTWMTCPEVMAHVKVPVLPQAPQVRVIDSSPWPQETRVEKYFRKIVRWLGGVD
jgi:hypothetical protein